MIITLELHVPNRISRKKLDNLKMAISALCEDVKGAYINWIIEDDLKLVRSDVMNTYDIDLIKSMSFTDFFNMVDTDQTYEEEWLPNKWRPYYEVVYNEIIKV